MAFLNLDQIVPDFNLLATDKHEFNLIDNRGKNIVLFFYPKDCTSGCTREGQDFRDNYAAFQELNTVIFGISRDSLKSHEKFKTEQQFPFPLLSDSDEIACKLFDVIKDKVMYGKKVRGLERSTFLIDKDGILRKAWRKVKVEGHVAEVLVAVKQLVSNR